MLGCRGPAILVDICLQSLELHDYQDPVIIRAYAWQYTKPCYVLPEIILYSR